MLAVGFYILLYFHAILPSGIFHKWDRFAMLVMFPLASVVFLIGQLFIGVGMIITELTAGAAGLVFAAVVIFIAVGIFEILLLGMKSVF